MRSLRIASALAAVAFVGACSLVTDSGGLAGGSSALDGGAPTDAASPIDAAVLDGALSDAGGATLSAYEKAVLQDQPVSYFRLAESGGVVAHDERGAHDGTYIGTPTFGAPSALATDPDPAVTFTNGGRMSLGNAFGFANDVPFTIEAWLKPPDSTDTYRFAVSKRIDGAKLNGYSIYAYQGAVCAEYADAGTFQKLCGAITTNVYSHVVYTKDPATCRLYVNDAIVDQSDCSAVSIPATAADLIVGAQATAGYAPFEGTMDELAFYDHALPAERVHAHYLAATKR